MSELWILWRQLVSKNTAVFEHLTVYIMLQCALALMTRSLNEVYQHTFHVLYLLSPFYILVLLLLFCVFHVFRVFFLYSVLLNCMFLLNYFKFCFVFVHIPFAICVLSIVCLYPYCPRIWYFLSVSSLFLLWSYHRNVEQNMSPLILSIILDFLLEQSWYHSNCLVI